MTQSPRLSQTSIHKFFASLPEPRRRPTRIKHPLLNLVTIAWCGTIAGADDWEEIVPFARDRRPWLSGFLDLSAGIPSHDTSSAGEKRSTSYAKISFTTRPLTSVNRKSRPL